jgi:hypothetical protein
MKIELTPRELVSPYEILRIGWADPSRIPEPIRKVLGGNGLDQSLN